MRITIPPTHVAEPERVARMQTDIIDSVSRLPGVEAAAFADALPIDAERRNGMIVAAMGLGSPAAMGLARAPRP